MNVLTDIWRIVILGVIAGGLYAPVSAGLVIVYRSSRLLNFAQGALCFTGGYAYYLCADKLGMPVGAAIPAALVIAGVLGLLIYFLLISPVVGRGPIIAIMVTIALSSALEGAVFLIFGSGQQYVPSPLSTKGVRLPGNVVVTPLDLAIVIGSVVILLALAAVLRYTPFGIAVRAVSDSPLLAGYWGQNSNRVIAWTWALSSALSALAGMAYAMNSVLDSSMLTLGTVVFPAVILGGMDSLGGAIIGSLMLGLAVQSTTLYLGAQWTDFIVYGALMLLLLARPYGFFGTREVVRL
ncbi:MAG TPA: branched-chain amino acid ABC transporter permease [Trebonia sp.]|nr:branched-chain amino acid ABC transporter permease [Trebonia sp.]